MSLETFMKIKLQLQENGEKRVFEMQAFTKHSKWGIVMKKGMSVVGYSSRYAFHKNYNVVLRVDDAAEDIVNVALMIIQQYYQLYR